MLEVKLLKVCHAGKEEARKLVPYILEADVWSEEEALMTEASARRYEDNWENVVLQSGWSRTEFLKRTQEAGGRMPPDQRDYFIAVKEMVYRNKLPIWHLERFSDEESKRLWELNNKNCAGLEMAMDSYHRDSSLSLIWEFMQTENMLAECRDREIARNIESAERNLRERYAWLSELPSIRLVACIGSLHTPERYTPILVKTVDLSHETDMTFADDLTVMAISGKSFDELRPKIEELCERHLAIRSKNNLIQP